MANEPENTGTLRSEPYMPFPFFGDQIILSSQRIHIHARDDSALIFARKSVGLSSLGTLNFDCTQKATINSPKIYLGNNASEPLIFGDMFVTELTKFLEAVYISGLMMKSVSEVSLDDSMLRIAIAGSLLHDYSNKFMDALPGVLSIVSYTE